MAIETIEELRALIRDLLLKMSALNAAVSETTGFFQRIDAMINDRYFGNEESIKVDRFLEIQTERYLLLKAAMQQAFGRLP